MNKRLVGIALIFFSVYAGRNKKWKLAWDSSERGCECSTKEEIKAERKKKERRRESADSTAALAVPRMIKALHELRERHSVS